MAVHFDEKLNRWVAVVSLGRGKRKKKTFQKNQKRLAQRWHDETKTQYLSKPVDALEKEKFTFDDALARYREIRLPQLATTTRIRYEPEIANRIEPFFKYRKLTDIDYFMMERFRAHLGDMPELSGKSKNSVMSILMQILKFAKKTNMLISVPPNPQRFEEKKFDSPDAAAFKWWDDLGDIDRFLTLAKRHSEYYMAFYTALETGGRESEIAGLSWTDVDFRMKRIYIWRQWNEHDKKFDKLKNANPRYVDVSDDYLKALAAYRDDALAKHPSLLFTTSTGKHVTGPYLNKRLYQFLKSHGIPHLGFHGLRHTFASWYMRNGGNLDSLQYLLGHKEIQSTMKYKHHSHNHRRDPINIRELSQGEDGKPSNVINLK